MFHVNTACTINSKFEYEQIREQDN